MALPGLTIGQVAEAAGLSRKAVRVYEAKGLLPATRRSAAGYRLYDDNDVELLTFIRRARTLGLHLDHIRDVLALQAGAIPPCSIVRDMLDDRIHEIDTTVAELVALRESLVATRQRADECTCADHEPVTACGVIQDTTIRS